MKVLIDISEKYLDSEIVDLTVITGANKSITDVNVENEYADFKIIEDDRPTLIYKGQVVYLTNEHIQAMAEWEKEQMKKELLEEQFKRIFDGLADFDWQTEMCKDYKNVIADLKGKPISGTVYQDSFCPHAHNCIEYIGYHCADRCPLKKGE